MRDARRAALLLMPHLPAARSILPGATLTPVGAARRWLLTSWPGRALLLGAGLKIVETAGTAVTGEPRPALLDACDAAGTLALILGGAYLGARALVWMRRRLLWRVRRKLILSYIFVGLVPSLLIVVFFLLAGLLLFRNVASYLVQTRLDVHAEQARFLAQTALLDVQRATTAAAARDTLEHLQASGQARYPFLSIALVPVRDITCPPARRSPNAGRLPPLALPAAAGPWAHLPAPTTLPAWITCDGASRIVAYHAVAASSRRDGETDLRLVARAVALPATQSPGWAVALDLPISAVVERGLLEETGIQLGFINDVRTDESMPVTAQGRVLDIRPPTPPADGLVDQLLRRWAVFIEPIDWDSGKPGNVSVELSLHLLEIYQRLATKSPLGGFMSNVLLLVLLVVGALFLLIQAVALVLGLALARQITGAVHDLFTGTEHLRNRNFTHVIPVRARDQFGELADSFNLMTGEVTRLLQDVAQKERLEQEFATAREIQMKLLPQGPLTVPGLGVSAYCEPAREVGGDYYDCFPVGDDVFGFLIADVSGKGVGAGLYMAQLKGLVLSLARQHRSPRDLLIAVNRVLVDHLDGRSFITMSYVVVDLRRQVMTYARAGHCPMIVAPAARGGRAAADQGAGPRRPGRRPDHRRRHALRVAPRGSDRAARARRPLHAVHRRHERDDEPGPRLLRRGTPGRDCRHPPRPAARRAGRPAGAGGACLRRRRGAARRHDHAAAARRDAAAGRAAHGDGGGPDGDGCVTDELAVVFSTRSEIEAAVVQGLLESQGLHAVRLSGPPATVFAFAVTPLGAIRIAVPRQQADEARRVLLTHGDAGGSGLVVPLASQFAAIEQRLRYRFRDRGLLEHALTHKSRAAEDPSGGVADNESLEFLGDAVLGFIVADLLYREFPEFTEGPKSKAKAALVSTTALADLSRTLGLGDDLLLGKGEAKTGGRAKPALLADVFEAVVAAIYLDGGIEAARTFVEYQLRSLVASVRASRSFGRDYKSALQETLQAQGRPLPAYRVAAETGPDHDKRFDVDAVVDGLVLATGSGKTKKEAEQEAARIALAVLAG